LLNTRSFLFDLCIRALEIDNSIKFVGVVNIDGKLIVGKSKQQLDKQYEGLDIHFFKYCLNPSFNKMSTNTINLNSSIDNKNTVFHSKLIETSDFHLICVTDNTYIAFTSLTQELDEYLCIYFKVRGSLNEILSTINTIFDYND
jgi:hypothetical protein